MDPVQQFLTVVQAYAAAHGYSEKTASLRVLGRGSQIEDIRNGSDVGVRRLMRALAFMSDNWPQPENELPPAARWPLHVERPAAPKPVRRRATA